MEGMGRTTIDNPCISELPRSGDVRLLALAVIVGSLLISVGLVLVAMALLPPSISAHVAVTAAVWLQYGPIALLVALYVYLQGR